MEIRKYINIIMKWLWLIILLPVIACVISAYVNFMVLEPIYKADTTLLITGINNNAALSGTNNNTVSFEDIIAGQTLVSEYSEIIRSTRVISAVIRDINEKELTEESLRKMISIDSVNDTRILDISIRNTHPVKAAIIADSVANAFSQEIVRLYKIENVDIIDKAEVPKVPVSPTKKKNIALVFVGVIIFTLSIILIIEYLDNTIKTSEDVEMHLGLNVIGNIPVHSLK